jgi:hypothetical protein
MPSPGKLQLIDNLKGTGVIRIIVPNKPPMVVAHVGLGTPETGVVFTPLFYGAYFKVSVLEEIVTLLKSRNENQN